MLCCAVLCCGSVQEKPAGQSRDHMLDMPWPQTARQSRRHVLLPWLSKIDAASLQDGLNRVQSMQQELIVMRTAAGSTRPVLSASSQSVAVCISRSASPMSGNICSKGRQAGKQAGRQAPRRDGVTCCRVLERDTPGRGQAARQQRQHKGWQV